MLKKGTNKVPGELMKNFFFFLNLLVETVLLTVISNAEALKDLYIQLHKIKIKPIWPNPIK